MKNKAEEPKIGKELSDFWEEVILERIGFDESKNEYAECYHPSLDDIIF